MSRTIRWGVIGMGRFGSIHASAIDSMAASEVAAVCTRDPQRLQNAAERFAPRAAYHDYRELLNDDDVDAVSITTHWKDHFEIAIDVSSQEGSVQASNYNGGAKGCWDSSFKDAACK